MTTKQEFIDEYVKHRESMGMLDSIGRLYDNHVPNKYSGRDIDIAFVIGMLNRDNLTMDELQIALQSAKEKIALLKESFRRGHYKAKES